MNSRAGRKRLLLRSRYGATVRISAPPEDPQAGVGAGEGRPGFSALG